jgi:tRNA(fMet)-specific endonuclease VapC
MKRAYLLDTGPAFDFLFRRRNVYERVREARLTGAKVGIGIPTLGEVIGGLEASTSRAESWEVAHRSLGQFVHWPFDEEAAYEYGRIFAELKRIGRIIQQIDMQNAAIVRVKRNCILVTYDNDFSAIAGLTIEDWSK